MELKKLRNFTHFSFKELNKFDKIYVLVSGGIDSTYLYELCLKYCDKRKIFLVNCYNPYEINKTLKDLMMNNNFMQIKPNQNYNYKEILRSAFLKLPLALDLKNQKNIIKKYLIAVII